MPRVQNDYDLLRGSGSHQSGVQKQAPVVTSVLTNLCHLGQNSFDFPELFIDNRRLNSHLKVNKFALSIL